MNKTQSISGTRHLPVFIACLLLTACNAGNGTSEVLQAEELLIGFSTAPAETRQTRNVVENLYLAGENHLQKDVEFHTYIARCSKNKVIEKLVPIIQSAVITFVNLTHRQLKDETIDTHRAITDAILNGDSAGAKYAMIMHLNYNRQMILKKQAKAQQKNE